jgi:prevent-host-death family protein
MITANMHEAKSQLSKLVAAAIKGEDVILCSKGQPRVRLVPVESTAPIRRDLIQPDPTLRVTIAPGYDPAEPLTEDEWPSEYR